jgi:sugar-specific transcriptional regulator TrmB
MQTLFSPVFTKLGLSEEQADIYESLLTNGAQGASNLAKTTKVKRTYVYTVCSELVKKGLIVEDKKEKKVIFRAQPPNHLLTEAENQKIKAELAQKELINLLPTLESQYRLHESKPLVNQYEGLEGLQKIYEDILKTNENLLLFRSIYDEKNNTIDSLIQKQIQAQVKNGIHTRTITPLEKDTKETYLTLDPKRLVERHIVEHDRFNLPSQILVYGEKVAIVSLKSTILATVIDNKDISTTFRNLFTFLWEASAEEHKQITASWGVPQSSAKLADESSK